MLRNDYISITIKNNTPGNVPVSILANPANLADNANQFREFAWDVTGFSFTNEDKMTIQYRLDGQSNWTQYMCMLPVSNLNAVLDCLNALGIGSFFSYTSGPNTYIATYNDNYEFGVLSIFNALTSVLSYSFTTTNVTGGTLDIDINFVNVVSDANPAGSAADLPVSAGDTVTFSGSAVTAPDGFVAEIWEDGTLIWSSSGPLSFSHTFSVSAGKTYYLTCYDTP